LDQAEAEYIDKLKIQSDIVYRYMLTNSKLDNDKNDLRPDFYNKRRAELTARLSL